MRRLSVLLFAAVLPAQIQDDPDLAIDPFGNGSHCLRMAHADDGRIVAAWAIHDAGLTPGSDEIAVGVSSDGGHSWRLLWDGRSNAHHTNLIADMSITVTAVNGRGAPAKPWVYLAVEFVEHDSRMTSPQRRFIQCIDGSLDTPWPGFRLKGRHVHGQFTHQATVSPFMPSTRPSIGLPLYEENGQTKYLVVIAYRWWDAPSAGLYLSTPYYGDRGRVTRSGQNVWIETLDPNGAYPSLAADPVGRSFFVAYETGPDVVTLEIDPQQFRTGRPGVLATETVDTDLQRPHIAVNDSVVVLTALETRWNSNGSQPLRWYRKKRSAAWQLEGMLHNEAFSPAPIVIGEGGMWAAAHCNLDQGQRSASALVAFHARTSTTFPTVQSTRVGDCPSRDGLPSLALTWFGDRCAYGYADPDLWWFGGRLSEVLVDPAR